MTWTRPTDARRWWRMGVGLLALGTGLPILAMEWAELRDERDALAAEVRMLRARSDGASPGRARVEPSLAPTDPAAVGSSYAGEPLPEADARSLAWAFERQTQLSTEAAALRRELARGRSGDGSSQAEEDAARQEGELLAPIALRGSSGEGASGGGVELDLGATEQLRRRLERSAADLDEVQAERDEALAMLRREMFNSLLYSAVLGECGHRVTARAVDLCADQVRTRLGSQWTRFDACLRETNAVPSYTTAASARGVDGAVMLERGVVLMCDPRLPEGGRTGG